MISVNFKKGNILILILILLLIIFSLIWLIWQNKGAGLGGGMADSTNSSQNPSNLSPNQIIWSGEERFEQLKPEIEKLIKKEVKEIEILHPRVYEGQKQTLIKSLEKNYPEIRFSTKRAY